MRWGWPTGSGPPSAWDLATGSAAASRLAEAGVVGSVRAGRLRLAFHVNNTATDADRAVEALAGHVRT